MFLSEEHTLLRQTVRDFAEKEIAPHIREWDRSGAEASTGPGDSYVLSARCSSLHGRAGGLLGICIPAKYGGAGMDYLALAVVCEELERVDSFLRVVTSVHTGPNSLSLLQWGSEEQKERYPAPQASGGKLAYYGLTEPNSGTDAERDGRPHCPPRWRLVYPQRRENLDQPSRRVADHFLVFAKTDPALGNRGISRFIVERTFAGVSRPPHPRQAGRAR